MPNFGDLRYTAWGGGVRVISLGQVVGSAGISGLPKVEERVLARLNVDLFGIAKG